MSEQQNETIDESQNEELFKEIGETLGGIQNSTDQFFKRKLIAWGVRWIITIGLYIWLWNRIWWIKWTLLFTIPLGIWSLYVIINSKEKINKKLGDIERKL